MRALIDTNVFISYVLSPAQRAGTIGAMVEAALSRAFELLMPEALLTEIVTIMTTKPYVVERISAEEAVAFARAIRAVAIVPPAIEGAIPHVVRDPKDDYLLAYALVGGADYLVTGDRDLLDLPPLAGLTIVGPTAFAAALELGDAGGVA
ncbi:MAG TPA: putative toxin-antitoxin system toxin component, PIN family [Thermomicrobiales bacterium]|nr:putative toxin-antitoxin system toxin component, PIN family [Thermomicrobiales bacterium]